MFIGVSAQTIDTIDLTLVYWLYYICIINNIKTHTMNAKETAAQIFVLAFSTLLIVVAFVTFIIYNWN